MAQKEYCKIFIDAEDITRLHSCSKSKSYERLKEIARHHGLKPYQRVNIFQFCEYEGIPIESMFSMMKEVGMINDR